MAARDEVPPWMDEAPPMDLDAAALSPSGPDSTELDDAPLRPRLQEPTAATAPSHPASAAMAPRPAPIEVPRTALGDRWAEVVAAMAGAGSITALARELAMQAELSAVDALADTAGELWRLTVERETLRSPGLADKLLVALKAATGRSDLRLEVVAGVALDSPARRDAEAAALRQAEAERLIHEDPLVQAVLAQFSTARIVPGSIKPV